MNEPDDTPRISFPTVTRFTVTPDGRAVIETVEPDGSIKQHSLTPLTEADAKKLADDLDS